MSTFKDYSQYYDLLYLDKDYKGEVKYISNLINKFNSGANSILELGCGTGIHACMLAREGFEILGIDLSESMITQANKRREEMTPSELSKVRFEKGDVRNFKINKKFDIVISLFHVASYQVLNDDLQSYFNTAAEHLKNTGVFIFDFWYGPAVLTDLPKVRVKKFENQLVSVIRIAEPMIHFNKNIVDVNFTISIVNKESKQFEEIKECHSMRYLFIPEIEMYLRNFNFSKFTTEEWMTGSDVNEKTWGVTLIATR
jgi:SAM-dependent methyltransferase